MTDTSTATHAPTPPTAPVRLERPRDAALAGVCTALARATGTDVVLWRVLAVVATVLGGSGVVLYLLGIVLIPRQGQPRSIGDRLLHGPDRHLRGRQLVVVIALVVAVLISLGDTDGQLVAIVLGVLALVWWRSRPADSATRPVHADPVAHPAVSPQQGWTPPPPQAPRPRSPLTGLTLSLAAVVAGVLLLLGTTGTSVPAEVVLAAGLGVVGVGLVAGAFWGRSWPLLLVAAALGLALAGTVGARPAIDAGVGDRTWVPTGAESYRLGVGDATLDLRDVAVRESGTIGIDARVDVGHLLVLVPDGVRVSLDARAQLGDVVVFGSEDNGRGAHKHVELGEGAPQLRLDLSVRTGQVEVRHG